MTQLGEKGRGGGSLPAKEAELAAQIMKKRPVSRAVHPSKASSTRIRIFLNPQIIFADSKIFTSTRIHIQIEFARPHVSGFTRSSSANLWSDVRRMRKFYRLSSSITVSLTKLSQQALFRSFYLFTASNSSGPTWKEASKCRASVWHNWSVQ